MKQVLCGSHHFFSTLSPFLSFMSLNDDSLKALDLVRMEDTAKLSDRKRRLS